MARLVGGLHLTRTTTLGNRGEQKSVSELHGVDALRANDLKQQKAGRVPLQKAEFDCNESKAGQARISGVAAA